MGCVMILPGVAKLAHFKNKDFEEGILPGYKKVFPNDAPAKERCRGKIRHYDTKVPVCRSFTDKLTGNGIRFPLGTGFVLMKTNNEMFHKKNKEDPHDNYQMETPPHVLRSVRRHA